MTLISSEKGTVPVDSLSSSTVPRIKSFQKKTSSSSMDESYARSVFYQRTSSPSSSSQVNSPLLPPLSCSPSPTTTPTSSSNRSTEHHFYELTDVDQNKYCGYDKLSTARKEAYNFGSKAKAEDTTVEKRIKSPSPKVDCTTVSPPLSPPLTPAEINHLKHYNKEPLINISATVHNRRNAEYATIDLPDSASDSSRPSSLYDVPSRSLSQVSDKVPSNISEDQCLTYDVPRFNHSSMYDIPRSTHRESIPLTQRALPHLPTDYVNITLQEEADVSELYSEIPVHKNITKPNNVHDERSNTTVKSDGDVVQAKYDDGSLRPGQKLAQELAEEEGYILVNPATLPALSSPSADMTDDNNVDDEYIEVRRNVSNFKKVTGEANIDDHEYINISNSAQKLGNGYEEVQELRSFKKLSPTFDEPDTSFDIKLKDSNAEVYSHLDNKENIDQLNVEEVESQGAVSIPERKLIPVVQGSPDVNHVSLIRKRSLTIGDPLDTSKQPKKHTYVNVPDEQLPLGAIPPHPCTDGTNTVKKPMPLPRPSSKVDVQSVQRVQSVDPDPAESVSLLNICANTNNNCNSKVKTLIHQFSQ